MTQTVILTQPVRVAGSVLDAGTTQALADDIAADLVARGFATSVGIPAWQSPTQNVPRVIAQSTIPFLIMPGDGASAGCSFSGAAGAFTLSAAIIANIGTTLAGCYAYFSANFGGSTLPAGWYWTEFSSDTAGIVYADTYTSGTSRRPATKTPISVNLTGRITSTGNEVTAQSGLLLPANSLGKNGFLTIYLRVAGSTANTKTFRVRADDGSTTMLGMIGTTTSPIAENLLYVNNIDSHTEKVTGRNTTASGGIGQSANAVASNHVISLNTAVNQNLYLTAQQSTNVACAILTGFVITATYGE